MRCWHFKKSHHAWKKTNCALNVCGRFCGLFLNIHTVFDVLVMQIYTLLNRADVTSRLDLTFIGAAWFLFPKGMWLNIWYAKKSFPVVILNRIAEKIASVDHKSKWTCAKIETCFARSNIWWVYIWINFAFYAILIKIANIARSCSICYVVCEFYVDFLFKANDLYLLFMIFALHACLTDK